MRVLEVINSLQIIGGAENFAVNFAISASKIVNLDIVILYDQEDNHLLKKLKKENINIIFLSKKKHFDQKCIAKLRRILEENQYDYIHTENNALITTYFAVRHLKRKPRIFHTIHNPAKIEAGNFVSRILYKRFFKKDYCVPVGISQKMADSINEYYHMSNAPFIDNGVDLSCFKSEIPLQNREIDISVVARLSHQKNYPFLIKLFSMLHAEFENIKICIAGDGEEKSNILSMIDNYNENSYVTMLGNINDVSILLNNTKIILLGSFYEGNPLSLIEGMASGDIVVSTNVGGIPDIVKNEKNGFLFDLNDYNKALTIIKKILEKPDNYQKMSIFNSNCAKNYSIEKTVANYVSLFKSQWKRKGP